RIRHRAKWIIDQENMRPNPIQRTTHTDRKVRAACLSAPAAACLTVLGQTSVKNFCVFRSIDRVSHITAKILTQRGRRTRTNELQLGMAAEYPGGKASARKLALAMPRRHQQHQSVNLAARYALELRRNLSVQMRGLI